MKTLKEFVNYYNEKKEIPFNWFATSKDYCFDGQKIELKVLGLPNETTEQIENENYKNFHCGCSYDCCGCLCGQYISFEKISRGKTKITFTQNFNY